MKLDAGAIRQLADTLGWDLQYDNDGQIVLYTDVYDEQSERGRSCKRGLYYDDPAQAFDGEHDDGPSEVDND